MSLIASAADASTFLFAGKAVFTLKSKKTGEHYTYRVTPAKTGEVFFVSVVQGGAKLYAGIIPSDNRTAFRSTRASKLPSSHPAVRGFEWFLANIGSDRVELHHEGKCGRCCRKLTHPESIKNGLGPECAQVVGEARAFAGPSGARLQHLPPMPAAPRFRYSDSGLAFQESTGD